MNESKIPTKKCVFSDRPILNFGSRKAALLKRGEVDGVHTEAGPVHATMLSEYVQLHCRFRALRVNPYRIRGLIKMVVSQGLSPEAAEQMSIDKGMVQS